MGNLILYGDYINKKKEEEMKRIFLLLVLSVSIFAAEYNTDDIDIYYKGGKFYPVQDGIILEGENTFIVGRDSDRAMHEWIYYICTVSSYYTVKKVDVTYEKSKMTEKAVCYDSKDEVITKKKK